MKAVYQFEFLFKEEVVYMLCKMLTVNFREIGDI